LLPSKALPSSELPLTLLLLLASSARAISSSLLVVRACSRSRVRCLRSSRLLSWSSAAAAAEAAPPISATEKMGFQREKTGLPSAGAG